jgi:maleate isomerase
MSETIPRASIALATAVDERAPEGWRARLGVVVPSVNTVVEPWFSASRPAGVSIHAARMLLDDALSPEAIVRMDREEGQRAVRQLASCRPQAVAYCCTASSIVQGLDYDRHLQSEIAHQTGVACTTATQAILEALRVLGVRTIAAASPYAENIDHAEHDFFESAGVHVASSACLGIRDAFELARPSSAQIIALARRAYSSGVQAILITCLNLWSHVVIEQLERELGVPVITSTQATFWRLLRIGGVEDRIAGYGRLLAEH